MNKAFCCFWACVMILGGLFLTPSRAQAAFGLTTTTNYYQVDTGAGLVFQIRRVDAGVSTQSPGDIMSLKYNGVEYQDTSRGSQVNSGFDYIYTGFSSVSVTAPIVNSSYIEIEVQAGDLTNPQLTLTHYYLVRKGYPMICMGTYFLTEPQQEALCRYILRLPHTLLPNGSAPADLTGTDTTVESGDVFGFSATNANNGLRGQTRSKHYSNHRLIDWAYIGATGTNVGAWVVRDNNEGNSGGPFFRCLLNQGGTDQEITYIVNYGEGQTEAFRPGILNTYALVFTTGAAPTLPIDTSWFSTMNMIGYVPSTGRGTVSCPGIGGRDTVYPYTVGFSNTTAQYWTAANAGDGSFTSPLMIPGTYTMMVYKNELSVYTGSVTVTAGGAATIGAITITSDPSASTPVWRVGDWDGTPNEFLNADKVTTMHPSDVRMAAWNPGTYVVGSSSPATGFPCYQWKDVNSSQEIDFTLTSAQVVTHMVRVGITTAYSGGRPKISVNSWTAANTNISTQPNSRTLTVGTYRGNNTMYTFSVPASAFVVGLNKLYVYPISGNSGTLYLSPGYSTDAVDLLAPSLTIGGVVKLQNWTGAPQSLTFTLTPNGATTGGVTTQTVTPNTDGSFALSNVAAGTYTLGIKGTRWLRRNTAISTRDTTASNVSVTLLAGDVNNDNQITGTDLAIERKAYGSSPGAANWTANADLDGDGHVTMTDLSLLRGNYGVNGDK